MKIDHLKVFGVLLVVCALVMMIHYFFLKDHNIEKDGMTIEEEKGNEPIYAYGLSIDSFKIDTGVIQPNEFLSDILTKQNVPYQKIHELSVNCKNIYDVRDLVAGKSFFILNKDTSNIPDYFIYCPNEIDYVVYDLKNPCAKIGKHKVRKSIKVASGEIKSSLWNSMVDAQLPWSMISKMESALAWSVDFYHVQKGDKFKLIFEEYDIDGNPVDIGELLGAYYMTSSGKEYYSILFDTLGYRGYFDREGRPMKRAFLKSPVEYGRISSSYNLNRRHPILNKVRPHLGTDYAAPKGTPIRTVASGTVTHAAYSGGNGKYIKIRHDKTYTTQYLHMSAFAKGLRTGTKVKQGEVIGYVGSTGLATGPHVCFRFWKNGRQVDHRKEDLPNPKPMPDSLKLIYDKSKKEVIKMLDKVEKTYTFLSTS